MRHLLICPAVDFDQRLFNLLARHWADCLKELLTAHLWQPEALDANVILATFTNWPK